ncbi:hypothetical protein BRC90_04035 [Halobacteriales archaeon QS_4_69_34]|nr:MAG: hypothetical protein BRC90_04035 [Halobacteriales archaeon QS_4_69_34]
MAPTPTTRAAGSTPTTAPRVRRVARTASTTSRPCEPCHDRAHDHDVFAGSGRIGDSDAGSSHGIGATLVRVLVVSVASLPLLLPVGGVYARYLDENPRLPLVAELALLVGVVLVAGAVVLRRPRTVLAGSVLLGAVGAGAVWAGDVQPTAATSSSSPRRAFRSCFSPADCSLGCWIGDRGPSVDAADAAGCRSTDPDWSGKA